ncbi:hypothetical protein [Nissabacter archeti]|uniref:hypothetical protein n=1 Tax=Nissabacter archeti TaxID=1917880 RepID=UPI0009322C2B|nr:hypothetical protein [Nissabacter archeti]
MAPLARNRNVLKWLFFIVIFFALSKCEAERLTSDFFMDFIANKIACFILDAPEGERMYYAYSYTIMGINLTLAIAIYSLFIQILSIRSNRERKIIQHLSGFLKGFIVRLVKVLLFISVFNMLLLAVEFTGFNPEPNKYWVAFIIVMDAIFSVCACVFVCKFFSKLKCI